MSDPLERSLPVELTEIQLDPQLLGHRSRRRPRYWLHLLLLASTFLTTLMVGMTLENNFLHNMPTFSFQQELFPLHELARQPSRILLGLPYSVTLLLILVAHELGHYIACRYYRVDATLPFFIPAPTLIGTLGAFIRIRSRIPSRAALFDIGVAGPIAGFAVAVPALMLGMSLSRVAPALAQASDLQLGYPLIFYLLAPLKAGGSSWWGVVRPGAIYLHPIAVAAWVGMFATALNLLPGGQLDGGHIVYSLWPRAHKWITRLLVITLLLMSPFLWPGWLLWSGMLLAFGGRHPYVPSSAPFGAIRRGLALFALLMLMLTFTPTPFPGTALDPAQVRANLGRLMHYFR